MSDAMDALNNLIGAMEKLHPVRFDELGWQAAKENLRECVRALELEVAEYRGLIDGDVDAAWRQLTAERDALKTEVELRQRLIDDLEHNIRRMW